MKISFKYYIFFMCFFISLGGMQKNEEDATLDRLQRPLKYERISFEPIRRQYIQEFYYEVVPAVRHKFALMGLSGSANEINTLIAAEIEFGALLSSLEATHNLEQEKNAQNIAKMESQRIIALESYKRMQSQSNMQKILNIFRWFMNNGGKSVLAGLIICSVCSFYEAENKKNTPLSNIELIPNYRDESPEITS